MTTAIIIIIALGIFDAMLFLACIELEKRQEEWEKKDGREQEISDR